MTKANATDSPTAVRVDRWLWAARFFKTRALAVAAVDAGHVHVNGARAKRAKPVHVGDDLRIRKRPYEFQIKVTAVSDRRGPPATAAELYEETPESARIRSQLATQLRAQPSPVTYRGKGRPTKRDRRQIDRFKHGS